MRLKFLPLVAFALVPFEGECYDFIVNPTIVAPMDGCELSASTILTVNFVNLGTASAGTVNVSYSVNGGPVVNESFSTPVGSGAVYTYSFVMPADLSPCQAHSVEVTVDGVGDTNPSNNVHTFTIISDCAPVQGSIAAPTEVCADLNSGNLLLTGYTGNIEAWIFSTDGGGTWTWAGSSASQPYSNLNTPTDWKVIVASPFGLCDDDTTASIHIDVVPQSIAGTLPADFDICDNGNAGQLDLTGYNGSILEWQFSQDGGATWTSIPNTNDFFDYASLTDTTLYQVVVQNGICPAVISTPVTLTLIQGSDAGSIVGELLVCNFENDSSLQANPVNGSVIDWNISLDNGATWTSTGVAGPVYVYSGLTGYTLFAAIVQASSCPADTVYHSIVVLPLAPSAGADISIYEGDSVMLNASGGSYFSWFPNTNISDIAVPNPLVWPATTTEYFVSISDINGCTDTASVTVTVLPDIFALTVPNLLTPNGDGYNDYLVINNIDTYPNNEIHIFNAYGQVIYHASPYTNSWSASYNGAAVPDGTYYYTLDLNEPADIVDPYQGVITIVGN